MISFGSDLLLSKFHPRGLDFVPPSCAPLLLLEHQSCQSSSHEQRSECGLHHG